MARERRGKTGRWRQKKCLGGESRKASLGSKNKKMRKISKSEKFKH
jgi:hypothetical protein